MAKAWTKGKAAKIERKLDSAIKILAEYNEENERRKINQTLKSTDLSDHKDAKDAERGLRSIKFVFDRMMLSNERARRKI